MEPRGAECCHRGSCVCGQEDRGPHRRTTRGAGRMGRRTPEPYLCGVDPHRIAERLIPVLLTERIVL